MGKLVLFILFSFNAFAISPDNIFQDDYTLINKIILSKPLRTLKFKPLPQNEKFNRMIEGTRVRKEFQVPKFFLKRTKFWFDVYSEYDSNHVIIHDKENLSFVFDVIDFRQLTHSIVNKNLIYSLQVELVEDRIKELKETFYNLITKTKDFTPQEKSVLNILKKNKINIPQNPQSRKKLFLSLSENIRSQTGQKNNIIQGLLNFQAFEEPISRFFKIFEMPYELRAVAFLESSFNLNAKSKVGATGVWQFMGFIGKHFMRVNSIQDERLNPVISSLAALHLLKENYKILGRWDLAVTAYNSGTKHIIRARRKLGIKTPSLEQVLRSYDHPHYGFASENFYASFLALVYSLSYQSELYDLKFPHSIIRGKYKNLHVYVTHCDLIPNSIFKVLEKDSPDLRYFNNHIIDNSKNLPAGSIFISDVNLNKKRYTKVTGDQLRRLYPKNYFKYKGECVR